MLPKTVIHLLSGGMDSTVLLYDLIGQGCKVHCVLFDYKQRHVQELQFAKYHCHRMGALYTTIEIQQLKGSELTDGKGSVVVPARNGNFLMRAVNIAVASGSEAITFAANKDDEAVFPDCRMAFIQSFNNLLITMEIQVEVCAPYLNHTKSWIAARGRDIGVDLSQTWSCYKGGNEPCGNCPACEKRNAAMRLP